MNINPTSLLSTSSDAMIKLPDSNTFKTANDLATKSDISNIQTQLQSIEQRLNIIKQDTLESIYKIGDIIYTTNSENPSVKFGGTWEQYAQGRVLLGVGDGYDIEQTGGEKEHILAIEEMPRHRHAIRFGVHGGGGYFTAQDYYYEESRKLYSEYEGDSQPHNNIQPYIAVYIWRKIA